MNSTRNNIFSIAQKFGPSERLLFYVLGIICISSGVYNLVKLNNKFLVEVPTKGGVLIEGMVSSPRFINPVIAISDTDRSLSRLVYSGLIRPTQDGNYEGDLAESISMSDDGLVYEVKIKDSAVFQDNKPVTSDDVSFTIEKTLDPVVKSPKRANWEGVIVDKINDKELRFTLKKPYFPFLESLTIGILPKHIWQEVSSEEFAFSDKNVNPVGSGPYEVSSVEKNSSGLPVEISLQPFKKYVSGDALISELQFTFFQNEDAALTALENGNIEALGGVSPANISRINNGTTIIKNNLLPRIFGAFFNQNQATVFANKEVRQALDIAIDKNALAKEILNEFGTPIAGPTAKDTWVASSTSTSTIDQAKEILTKAGWKPNSEGILEKKLKTGSAVLQFSISTSDVPDLKRTAEILRDTWNALGANVDIKVFDGSDLSQNVIKPRKYDVLLFGEIIGRDSDLYPFWHSSERNDPGLNISLYTNISADKLLEEIRGAISFEERDEKLAELKEEIKQDIPAIFLYAPKYVYVLPGDVKNVSLLELGSPSDRFINVNEWYTNTAKIWSIFAKN